MKGSSLKQCYISSKNYCSNFLKCVIRLNGILQKVMQRKTISKEYSIHSRTIFENFFKVLLHLFSIYLAVYYKAMLILGSPKGSSDCCAFSLPAFEMLRMLTCCKCVTTSLTTLRRLHIRVKFWFVATAGGIGTIVVIWHVAGFYMYATCSLMFTGRWL